MFLDGKHACQSLDKVESMQVQRQLKKTRRDETRQRAGGVRVVLCKRGVNGV
jgi:hypothetical protein